MLVLDYNPEVIKSFIKKKQPCLYGDIGDLETISRLNFKSVDIVVSTVSTQPYNIMLIQRVKEQNKDALIFVTTEEIDNALELYDTGADYVILPHFLGGEYVSVLLEESAKNMNKLIVAKLKHIEELKKRKRIGHEHPKHH
ncbi:NAD-binding protein [Candidatus Woesearchaeota archaeon]|nr:NAD-binding protein [Candidatus Woesearchaeota archaeon]